MLNERASVIKRTILFLDALVVAVSFLISFFIREQLPSSLGVSLFGRQVILDPFPLNLGYHVDLLLFAIPIWGLLLYWNGAYRSWPEKGLLTSVRAVFLSALLAFISLSTVIFVLQLKYVSRLFIGLFVFMSFVLILAEKITIFLFMRQARRKGRITQRIVIVGRGKRAAAFIRMIKAHPEWGHQILGAIDDEPGSGMPGVEGVPFIGTLYDLGKLLMTEAIDEVFFILPRSRLDHIENSVRACETVGIKATVALDLFNVRLAKCRHSELGGIPFVSFDTTVAKEAQLLLKRLWDLAFSGTAIVVGFPVFLLIGLLVKLTSRGPVLFKQRRAGLNGRVFMLYKFRTMYHGAERLRMDMEHLNEMDGPVFKIRKDPRITPVGRILRKFSLDEFPQLFNVFTGHMSLIGPRALATYEAEKFEPWQRRRLSMRPGLTGLWQVSGRNKIDFQHWMELDLQYLDTWSIWLDMKIFAKTIPVVIFGIGAY